MEMARGRGSSHRQRAGAGLLLALFLASVSVGSLAAATPVTTGWTAKVGSAGVNGSVTVAAVSGGVGTISLRFAKLAASKSLAVTLSKGTCARVGAKLFSLAAIRTTGTGAATRTNSLTASAVRAITDATAGGGKIVVRIGSGGSAKCGLFVAKRLSGPQAVVQSFYDWYFRTIDGEASGDPYERPEIAKTFKPTGLQLPLQRPGLHLAEVGGGASQHRRIEGHGRRGALPVRRYQR